MNYSYNNMYPYGYAQQYYGGYQQPQYQHYQQQQQYAQACLCQLAKTRRTMQHSHQVAIYISGQYSGSAKHQAATAAQDVD